MKKVAMTTKKMNKYLYFVFLLIFSILSFLFYISIDSQKYISNKFEYCFIEMKMTARPEMENAVCDFVRPIIGVWWRGVCE